MVSGSSLMAQGLVGAGPASGSATSGAIPVGGTGPGPEGSRVSSSGHETTPGMSQGLMTQGLVGSRPTSGSGRPGAIPTGVPGPTAEGSWGSCLGPGTGAEATAGTSSGSAGAEAGDSGRSSSTGVSSSSGMDSRLEDGFLCVSGPSCICRSAGAGHRGRVTPGPIPRASLP